MSETIHAKAVECGSIKGTKDTMDSQETHKNDGDEDAGDDDEYEMPRAKIFSAVLSSINFDGIAIVASSARKASRSRDGKLDYDPRSNQCIVGKMPLHGSYNLVSEIKFSDGIQWMLKIPANGHRGCWNSLVAEALTSEALTLGLIGKDTDIPVPAVHNFDASLDNEIGCPYILMDRIKGKAAHQAWFDDSASLFRQEQIRLNILQSVATAMVNLSQYQFNKGGILKFDSKGNVDGIASAKVPDFHAELDRYERGDSGHSDLFYAKGPCEDPVSSLLHMLNRRGTKSGDHAVDRGLHEFIRLFTRFSQQYSGSSDDKFVLAHADFDIQNIMVEDDGTLSGIIDWDGVSTVPFSIGPLRYPLWLARDWEGPKYNYDVETGGPIDEGGRRDDPPEKLMAYRDMYSRLIETAMFTRTKDEQKSKSAAQVTRLSLVLGCLVRAADQPGCTKPIMKEVYDQVENFVGHFGDDDDSDTDSSSSDEEGEDSQDDESSTDSDESDEESDDEMSEESGDEDEEFGCPRCIAEEKTASLHLGEANASAQTTSNNIYISGDDHLRDPPAKETTNLSTKQSKLIPPLEVSDQSRKVKAARLVCGVGEKGCRGLARMLYRKTEQPASREWLHAISPIGQDDRGELSSLRAAIPAIRESKTQGGKQSCVAGLVRNPVAILKNCLRKPSQMHLEEAIFAEDNEPRVVSIAGEVMTEPKSNQSIESDDPLQPDTQVIETPLDMLEHSENCAIAPKNIAAQVAKAQEEEAAEARFRDTWARIGLELRNAGISGAMIKEDQAKISGWIISTQREKGKSRRDAEEAEAYRKQQEMKIAAERERQRQRKEKKAAKKAEIALEVIQDPEVGEVESKLIMAEAYVDKEIGDVRSVTLNQRLEGLECNLSHSGMPASTQLRETTDGTLNNPQRTIPITVPPPANAYVDETDQASQRSVVASLCQVITAQLTEPEAPGRRNSRIDTIPTEPESQFPISAAQPCEDKEVATSNLAEIMPVTSGSAEYPVRYPFSHITASGLPYPRNKACFCGSQHKYKKCCGRIALCVDTGETEVSKGPTEENDLSDESSIKIPPSQGTHSDSFNQGSSRTSAPSPDGGQEALSQAVANVAKDVSPPNPNAHMVAVAKTQFSRKDDSDIPMELKDPLRGGTAKAGTTEQGLSEAANDAEADSFQGRNGEEVTAAASVYDVSYESHEASLQCKGLPPDADETWSRDHGGMAQMEVLVALGKNELGAKRSEQLHAKFRLMLDVLSGNI